MEPFIILLGLRLFTVYGPRQCPDLAINKFSQLILEGKPILFFCEGGTLRDYTFVDDIVSGIAAAIDYRETPYEIINLGCGRTVSLQQLVSLLEKTFGKSAILNQLPEQPGDVPQTLSDISKARKLLNYNPQTDIETGIQIFSDWFRMSYSK